MSKAPKRVNKCLNAINHLNDFVQLHSHNMNGMFYKDQLTILSNSLQYMAVEHKKHRVLFLAKTKNKKLSFKARLAIAIRFILLGKTLEDLDDKTVQPPCTREFKRTSYKKAG